MYSGRNSIKDIANDPCPRAPAFLYTAAGAMALHLISKERWLKLKIKVKTEARFSGMDAGMHTVRCRRWRVGLGLHAEIYQPPRSLFFFSYDATRLQRRRTQSGFTITCYDISPEVCIAV